jgi:hypothetical protein
VPSRIRRVIGTNVASSVSDSWIGPWNDTWSPVHTDSKPSASMRCTSSNCWAGGLSESWAPKRIVTAETRP